jgi:hypothetical protein
MAIVQISRIQVRRGLDQDLPNLAAGEIGWSTDLQKLYIGNGLTTSPDYAPQEGRTEILTEHSNFLNSIVFQGTDSGYTSQTGIDLLHPVTRTLRSVLDDQFTIKSFGAVGDGVTDDTAAINRAIQQIYVSSLNGTHRNVQRTIRFPAGTYKVTSTILIPPNCTLVGDGKNNTVIAATTGTVFSTCDSLFQVGTNIGALPGSVYPNYILIQGIQVTTAAGTTPTILLDSTTDVIFNNAYIGGASSVPSLISVANSKATSSRITFDNCVLSGGIAGVSFSGTAVAVRIKNSTFDGCTTYGINVGNNVTGLVSENNYFNNIPTPVFGMTGNNYSYGDTINGSSTHGGIYSGAAKYGTGRTLTLANGLSTITTVSSGSGIIDYQLQSGTSYRFGTLKYNNSAGFVTFDDEYTEPSSSLNANLFIANSTGVFSCNVTSGSTTLKYNIKQFI